MSKSLQLFFSKNCHFQQLLANFLILFNLNVYPNVLKDSTFTSQKSVYENIFLYTESFTKVFPYQAHLFTDLKSSGGKRKERNLTK